MNDKTNIIAEIENYSVDLEEEEFKQFGKLCIEHDTTKMRLIQGLIQKWMQKQLVENAAQQKQ